MMLYVAKCITVAVLAVVPLALAQDRSFVDDLGNSFTTSIDKPTIVTYTRTAMTLKDFGECRKLQCGVFDAVMDTLS